MSLITSSKDHFKNIVSKICGTLSDKATDENIESAISKSLKNISENEKKIMFGLLMVIDDQLLENSSPDDLIKTINQLIQHQIEFLKIIVPNTTQQPEKNDTLNDTLND